MGRLDAEGTVYRARHAPGIPAPRVSDHPNLTDCGHPGLGATRKRRSSGQETEILKAYPDLEREDICEALRYATEAVRKRQIPLVQALTFLVDNLRRSTQRRPEAQTALLMSNVEKLSADLERGCVAVFEGARIRVRLLPIAR